MGGAGGGADTGGPAATVVVTGFPRSGNTWATELVAALYGVDPVNVTGGLKSAGDGTGAHASAPDAGGDTVSRVVKTHKPPGLLAAEPGRRFVLMVRHPLDVTGSIAAYTYRRFHARAATRWIARLLAARLVSARKAGGRWYDGGWSNYYAAIDRERFLVVRYEDLYADPARELARIADHVGRPRPPEAIAAAVEATRIDKMRRDDSRGKVVRTGGVKRGAGLPGFLARRVLERTADVRPLYGYG